MSGRRERTRRVCELCANCVRIGEVCELGANRVRTGELGANWMRTVRRIFVPYWVGARDRGPANVIFTRLIDFSAVRPSYKAIEGSNERYHRA